MVRTAFPFCQLRGPCHSAASASLLAATSPRRTKRTPASPGPRAPRIHGRLRRPGHWDSTAGNRPRLFPCDEIGHVTVETRGLRRSCDLDGRRLSRVSSETLIISGRAVARAPAPSEGRRALAWTRASPTRWAPTSMSLHPLDRQFVATTENMLRTRRIPRWSESIWIPAGGFSPLTGWPTQAIMAPDRGSLPTCNRWGGLPFRDVFRRTHACATC